MYKIGVFSKITKLTVKTLRYYDEIGLLKPATIDRETGYRFYDDENFEKAMQIKTLKRFDFSIKEILDVIDKIEEPDDMVTYLMEKAQQLEFKVRELREKQKQIRSEVDDLKEVKFMSEVQEVMIKELEDLQVACIRYKGKYQEVGQYLGQLFKQVGMHAVGAPFSLYYDEEYTEEEADVEVCVEVKKKVDKGGVTSRTLKGCKVVSIVHVGPYETLSKSYKAVEDYIIEKGLTSYAPSREIYHKGPGMLMKGNPEKYRTEIQMPVR